METTLQIVDDLFAPPRSDEFFRLPDETRDEVKLMLTCLEVMHKAGPGKMRKAYNSIAHHVQHCTGASYKTMKRKLDNLLATGDWRTLCDQRRTGFSVGQPVEFIDYWKSKFDANQRRNCGKAARDELLAEWYRGEEIPGYGNWRDYWLCKMENEPLPEFCPPWFIPSGWEYSNLMRHKPNKTERALTRFGKVKCKEQLLHIPQTREGMRFLEYITLDDVETDFLIQVPDHPSPVVMKCIVAKDIATDLGLRFGARPALPKDNNDGKHGIKRQDVKIIIYNILRTYGFPTDYVMHIIVERGTATLSEADAAVLSEISGGHIVVHWTSMIGGKSLPYAFADGATGNPTGKAWLETSFNPMHNRLGNLPGQKGAHYQLRPAAMAGRERELKALVKAGAMIPPALRAQLRLPFLSYKEAYESMEQLFRTNNSRTEHEMEGFEDVHIWRWITNPPAPWQSMENFPMPLPTGAEASIEIAKRPESPIERWHRLIQGYAFEKIPESSATLFLDQHHDKVTVRKGIITIKIDGKAYSFRDEETGLMENEAQYIAYYSRKDIQSAARVSNRKNDMACIYLTDGKGRYLGKLPLWVGVKRGDHEELEKRIAEKERALKRVARRVADRNTPAMSQRLEDIEANINTLEEAESNLVSFEAGENSSIANTTKNLAHMSDDMHAAKARTNSRKKVDVIATLTRKKKGTKHEEGKTET
jgi:hypothetical protein